MEFVKVNQKEFDEYVANSYKPHFMQTAAWGEVNETRGAKSHCLLLKDQDRIVGSCMLLEKKVLKYSTFYCPRGFIVDYRNLEDIKAMVNNLKEYVLKHNGLYFKFDPDIIIRKLNSECEPIDTFEDNLKLVSYLESLGCKHRGFSKKLTEVSAPRYTFRVKVQKEDLLNSLHPKVKNILRRNNPYGLNVYIGDESDLDNFYKPMKETAIRKRMYLEDQAYFDNFYKVLKKYGMADLYITKASIKDLKQKYEDLKTVAKNDIELVTNKKKKGNLIDLNQQLAKYDKELALIDEIKDDEIILSSMINAKFNNRVWTIHGANSTNLSFLNSNYEMYWQILQDAQKEGFEEVDFYGSEGEIDKSSDAFGLFQFKHRFNGDFDEFIGEFDYVTKPFEYKIIMALLKFRRKAKYVIQQQLNKIRK